MYTFLLWFNMLTFTLLFAATGCSVIRQIKEPVPWQTFYLLYQIAWAFWLLLTTFSFFQVSFIPNAGALFNQVLKWIRILFSFIIFNLLPQIVFKATGSKWKWWQALTSSGILLAVVAVYLMLMTLTSVVILNTGFHLFLALLTLMGYRRYRKIPGNQRKRFFANFLLLTSVYFLLFTLLNISFVFLPKGFEQEIGTCAIGLFTFTWSIVDILRFIQDWKRDSDPTIIVPDTWGISPREKEVVSRILSGATNKEISEELFISMRTVETHLHNIYRKCGVKTKIELLHRLKK